MTPNNASMFSDCISSMVPETEAKGSVIPEKEYTLGNLTVNALAAVLIGLVTAIFIPILLLAAGIVIFAVRRKK